MGQRVCRKSSMEEHIWDGGAYMDALTSNQRFQRFVNVEDDVDGLQRVTAAYTLLGLIRFAIVPHTVPVHSLPHSLTHALINADTEITVVHTCHPRI